MLTTTPKHWRIFGAALVLGIAMFGQAQAQQAQIQQPLSVIDWLGSRSDAGIAPPQVSPQPDEPAVTNTAVSPTVNVRPLSTAGPRQIGLVPSEVTGLPATLWVGSAREPLIRLIKRLPDLHLPAAQSLLYTVLLSQSLAPGNHSPDGDALALARVEKLVERGALDPALSLIEHAGATSSPEHFALWMNISLLTGTEDRACEVFAGARHLSNDYALRIFCDARARAWEDAALTLGSAKALGLLPADTLNLLEHFLDPESARAAPVVPRKMDPLTFRLFESIGEPVSTRSLSRAYAVANLRDIAGWKAQLEAAERLTRAGALPDNRLLGLYSERKAAASGGIWDRVVALQRFEAALASGSSEAVTKTLPAVWRSMGEAGLKVSFAALFADALSSLSLEGQAKRLAQEILLLSPSYEVWTSEMKRNDLAVQIARGEVTGIRPSDPMLAALHDAFSTAKPRADLVALAKQDRLGESILRVLALLHRGADGNVKSLTDALATLRALGLEDVARRAALQTLLLDSS